MVTNVCPFCSIDSDRIIVANEQAIAIADGVAITQGHTLVIPREHISSIFEMASETQYKVWELVRTVRGLLQERFKPAAFNIGVNDGKEAGQTVDHAHIHIIPRYRGDVEDPRGGVRWVIPSKAKYWD
jgi:diadenosine tetraphosphate (Ap4A) HIT family hydrolase